MKRTDKAFKGPKTYQHGKDSHFVLCVLDKQNKWHTLYSRDRPGSRAKKVFSDSEILLHLRNAFTAGEYPQFQIADAVFAYIGNHTATTSDYRSALYHWLPDGKQWRSGATTHIPFTALKTFTIVKDSTFALHVRVQGAWRPYIYSIDRPNEYSNEIYPKETIVANLKAMMSRGGYAGNSFAPESVEEAVILQLSDKSKVAYFSAKNGWSEAPTQAPAAQEVANTTRLWYRDHRNAVQTVVFTVDHARQLELFRDALNNQYPQVVERYIDKSTGEVAELFYEAFYWAYVAGQMNRNVPANEARIYFSTTKEYLVVRFTPSGGQPYTLQYKAWPTIEFFQTQNSAKLNK